MLTGCKMPGNSLCKVLVRTGHCKLSPVMAEERERAEINVDRFPAGDEL